MTYWDGERWLDERGREPQPVSKARRVFTHSWQLLLEGSIVALLVVGLVAGTAFAGKGAGGGKTTTTAHGSCTAADVSLGSQYTIVGSGFKPDELLSLWVSD